MDFLDIYKDACSGEWITAGYDVQYRIEWHDKRANVYFQGSCSKEDWKLDFDCLVEPYRSCNWFAHRGFVSGYKSVRDEIMKQLEAASDIYISGYSLGAAYAQLLHEDIAFTYPGASVSTVVFGTPRVFWFPNAEVRGRTEAILRINVRGDIVSTLPPWIMGFAHVGWQAKIGPISILRVKKHLVAEYEKYLRGVDW